LADSIEKRLGSDCFDIEIGAEGVAGTLADILQAKDRRLSEEDASQVAYARVHSDTTVLYMRDGPAQRQAKQIGAPVQDHTVLVDHMAELEVVTPERRARLRAELDAYFGQRRRRSR
jgi:hypothetical protein